MLLCEIEIGFALREIAFGLGESRLVVARVQYVQGVARAHFLPGPEQPLLNVSVDPRANVDGVAGVGLRRVLGIDRHIGGASLRHQDGRAGRRRGGTLSSCLRTAAGYQNPWNQNEKRK